MHEINEEIPRLETRHRQAMRFFDYINKENLEVCLKVLEPEAKAAEMEHAIKHEIRVKLDENPVLYTSLKERLEELIEKRKERQMTIEELLEEYHDIIDRMRSNAEESAAHGFEPEQYPFYQMLASELDGFEEDNVKELTHIITEIIQENAVIDWTFKDDVKREMRKRIKRQLRTNDCPSKEVENLARQLMELAEAHYKQIAY
ncbi:type I restriction enzyme endonuclease domain-containing protein [Lentibacillus sp. CBA3610]|uniref:type I restriction enzyme endonuclease domain-containing protein n=1 Tax=Lentibacillus sp. CBA3610 TaxID=2518176 RepID=UPI00159545BE|nr:type I restriction enzyme endonuclease domain-containing protein [Lentibacillus sp. CBA3610]QKY68416.1 DUF3387 domain-containing protein [Lentibacillus sp. CBA3610]